MQKSVAVYTRKAVIGAAITPHKLTLRNNDALGDAARALATVVKEAAAVCAADGIIAVDHLGKSQALLILAVFRGSSHKHAGGILYYHHNSVIGRSLNVGKLDTIVLFVGRVNYRLVSRFGGICHIIGVIALWNVDKSRVYVLGNVLVLAHKPGDLLLGHEPVRQKSRGARLLEGEDQQLACCRGRPVDRKPHGAVKPRD